MKTRPLLRFWIKPFFVNVLFLLLLLPSFAQAAHPPEDDFQVFYKTPTYNKFLKVTEYMSAYNMDKHINSLAIIFTMLALEQHKDFAPQLVKDFGGLKKDQQVLIFTGLIGTESEKEMNEIKTKYKYQHPLQVGLRAKQLKNLQLLKSVQNLDALEQQTNIMDFLWAAFFATGDEKYLEKMVDYMAKNQNYLTLPWDEELTKDQQHQKIAIEALLWSIKSNSCKDPQIKAIFVNLTKKYNLNALTSTLNTAVCEKK